MAVWRIFSGYAPAWGYEKGVYGMEKKENDISKYNLLTRRLLEAGYTLDNHPDYVTVQVPFAQKMSLDNDNGGFTFQRWWIFEQTFKTPCGLLCKGLQCHSGMWYMGIGWNYENDMATVHCPYEKSDCTRKHEYLQRHPVLRFQCEVHMTDEEYRYEGSLESIKKLHDDEVRRKELNFSLQKNGHVCREHMFFNRDTQEWEMHYDPYRCGQKRCSGMCPVLGHELDKKKGNVFYDVKTKYLRQDLEGTLFEGQVDVSVIKGQKLFDHPVSMDIGRMCVEMCQDRIREKVRNRYSRELFFSEYYGKEFSVEVENVRAERREARDLMQDLEDIRNGIQVSHASDMEKRNAAQKKEKRQKQHEAAVKRLEKKLMETGYGQMEKYSLDRRHADKWLGEERIAELEKQRRARKKEELEQPVQLSLFDAGIEKAWNIEDVADAGAEKAC